MQINIYSSMYLYVCMPACVSLIGSLLFLELSEGINAFPISVVCVKILF